MKTAKLLLPGVLLLALAIATMYGCKEKTTGTKDTPASDSTAQYPYTIKHPDNWEAGNTANTLIALKSLKAWEEGKMDESMKYFGDSILLQFDGRTKNCLTIV